MSRDSIRRLSRLAAAPMGLNEKCVCRAVLSFRMRPHGWSASRSEHSAVKAAARLRRYL